jgi:hypothetical protein
MGANHLARNPAKCLASYPRNVPAIAGQWQQQCRRASVKTTRKTTCLAPDLAAQVRAGNLRDNSQYVRAMVTNRPMQRLTSSTLDFSSSVLTKTSKIMNTPITPMPDLELLRQAVKEYQPDPSRIPFGNLKPFHDSIVELRSKNASYIAITDLLIQNGVKTSRARVAEYGRIVLEGGKKRKRRKRTRTTPAPTTASAGNVRPPPKQDSPYRSRGPHIANVKMMTASEREEFEASLKSKPPVS